MCYASVLLVEQRSVPYCIHIDVVAKRLLSMRPVGPRYTHRTASSEHLRLIRFACKHSSKLVQTVYYVEIYAVCMQMRLARPNSAGD